MKKWIAILLIPVLLLCTACGNKTAPETAPADTVQGPAAAPLVSSTPLDLSRAGHWELIRVDSDDPDVRATDDDVAAARKQGVPMYLELQEDGTGVFCIEDSSAIRWDNNTITVPGSESFPYTVTDSQLSIDMEELTCVFVWGEAPNARSSEMEDAGFVNFMNR